MFIIPIIYIFSVGVQNYFEFCAMHIRKKL